MSTMFNKLVGRRIAEELEKRNMSQQQLADQVDCSKQVMSKILRGDKNITIFEMRTIADILGVTVDDLSKPSAVTDLELLRKQVDFEPFFMGEVQSEEGQKGVRRALRIIDLILQQQDIRERINQPEFKARMQQTADFSGLRSLEGE
ncbi:helix-turn-helix domain-containing protein [Tumebacillus permanentifrigoris]|uniref:DNA-binding XRE family transcriptional regulator n=1 Tax=Tumebacillus permanentifrigoris TaxID=378543 RepID=A0A316DAR3_9BACL|nr:helix-turn-helix transcriptional regulator [Tumebacillus permanentifrigoris]PWK13497.1 DNA-binding XRE family transcriptional regulator [Tumebacillus permanentifrigoris]